MAYQPLLDLDAVEPLIERLERLRSNIHDLDVPEPLARWLARYVEARGAHMSTRIEGNPMTEREVIELFEDDRGSAATRSERENLDYRDAARFAVQAAGDFYTDMDGGLIRAFHFLTVRTAYRYDTAGQYRTLQNAVMAGSRRVYLPPPPGEVPARMDALVAWLREQRHRLHPLILTAVAHAEFVKIHPFDDGNGRTARALSVYFMARGGWRLRGFVGVEQVFGEDIDQYRSHLNDLGEYYPGEQPDLTAWVVWFLNRLSVELELDLTVARHYQRLITEDVQQTLLERNLPPRLAHAYGLVWLEGAISASQYAEATGVTAPTAGSDLRRLVDMGILRREGRGRSTRYRPTDEAMVLDRVALRAAVLART
ncbi:MAG: Fic family protein [Dehalococcoidia bacterium]|nr:Fic family protein [Dehalococcoidia bacterium]